MCFDSYQVGPPLAPLWARQPLAAAPTRADGLQVIEPRVLEAQRAPGPHVLEAHAPGLWVLEALVLEAPVGPPGPLVLEAQTRALEAWVLEAHAWFPDP